MRNLKSKRILPVAGLVIMSLATGSVWGEAVASKTKLIVDQARKLQRDGKFYEAVSTLNRNRAHCSEQPDPEDCTIRLYAALGQLYQTEAGRNPAKQKEYLSFAIEYYKIVLSKSAFQEDAIRRLAYSYQSMNQIDNAIALLQKTISAQKGQVPGNYVRLGQLLEQTGKWDAAQNVYRTGIAANPESSILRREVIGTYGKVTNADYTKWFQELNDWEPDYPNIVSQGYERFLEEPQKLDEELAEKALVHWVALIGQQRNVYLNPVEQLQQKWGTPALKDLQSYMQNPQQEPGEDSWWMGDIQKKEALALFSLSLGRKAQIKRNMALAEKIWTTARKFAPDYGQAVLELNTELGVLYLTAEKVDPGGDKLKALQAKLHEDLFLLNRILVSRPKVNSSSFGRQYNEARQRYHTVLGYIYNKQKIWGDDKTQQSAIYQFLHVLDVADVRKADAGLQPLPAIKQLIAKAYVKTGNIPSAQRYYLEAAEAYLDLDQVRSCGRMLGAANKFNVSENSELKTRAEEIYEWFRLRTVYSERAQIDQELLSNLEKSVSYKNFNKVSKSFVRRNQFRVYADLASNKDLPQSERREKYAPKAWSYLDKEIQLIGTRDLLRVRDLVKERPARVMISQAFEANTIQLVEKYDSSTGILISLPTQKKQKLVEIPDELVAASRLFNNLSQDKNKERSPKAVDRFEVTPGTIYVRTDASKEEFAKAKKAAYGDNPKLQALKIKRIPSAPEVVPVQ